MAGKRLSVREVAAGEYVVVKASRGGAVRNAQGKVVAAMSVSTFTARLTLQELRDQCLPVLQQNAALLGCML